MAGPDTNRRLVDPGRKAALVIEGGGLRGAFAVGVLRTLFEYGGPDQFDSIYAVSSGVFAATYFAAGQVEEMENTWRDRVHGRQLVDFWNVLRRKPILKLDYLVDLFRGPVYLDLDRVFGCHPSIIYILTNCDTGQACYANAKSPDIFELMRASAAMPGAYPKPVIVDGVSYTDGATSDPIPVAQAIQDGHDEVLVILTRPVGYVKRPTSRVWARLCYARKPAARAAFLTSHVRYNEALDTIAHPPAGVRMSCVRPTQLLIGRLTRRRDRIVEAIQQGKDVARQVFDRLVK